jgi:ActR/RegA family two-component response regulator
MTKVLLVDDMDDSIKTISGVLTDRGFVVESAYNEFDANKLFLVAQNGDDPFDFVVIDVRLHGGEAEDESGLNLAGLLRLLNEQVHIILYTGGRVKSQQIVHAIRYTGAIDFIEESEDKAFEILKSIQKAIAEEKRIGFKKFTKEIRLALSLALNQPIHLRSQGSFTVSTRTDTQLHVNLDQYARLAENARNDPLQLHFQAKDIGNRLWIDLFNNNPEAFEIYSEISNQGAPVNFQFEATGEFLRLPLEFLRKPDTPDYLSLQHPISRMIFDVRSKREAISPSFLAKKRRLQILLLASNTEPSIPGVDSEILELGKYFKNHHASSVSVTLIPSDDATIERVREELKNPRYDLIHYAGHGYFDPSFPDGSFLLFWEGKKKGYPLVLMKVDELKFLLGQSEARFVYLSSCLGTATGSQSTLLDGDFLGLADAVVQAGVPSVVGFRWPVSDEGSKRLSMMFYKSLLEQGSPEIALWRARSEFAATNKNDPAWLSPILIHQK